MLHVFRIRNFLIIFIYFSAIKFRTVQNEKFVKLLNISCEDKDLTILHIQQCKIQHTSRDIFEVTVASALYLRPVNNATLIVAVVKSGFEDRKPLVDYKLDCCAFFRSKRRSFIASFIYNVLGFHKYSNMNHSCPFENDLLLDHYPFNGKEMGKVFPFGYGGFSFETNWYIYEKLAAVAKIRFVIIDR